MAGQPEGFIPFQDFELDRASLRRTDPQWLDAAFAADNVRILLMREGMPLVEAAEASPPALRPGMPPGPGAPLLWLGAQAAMLSARAMRLFLGVTPKGSPVFALDLPPSFSLGSSPIAGLGSFWDFRAASAGMSAFDMGAVANARSLFEWHRRHGFCSNCGTATAAIEAGWKRVCPDCSTEHFPRTDPVAIMLAVKGDLCLMGRQAAWPPGFWSCLAGFVEPGETFEQAAVREIQEEAGIRATTSNSRYLFCQPWPFPSSLMIGLIVEAETDEIDVVGSELEAARWFTREEARAMLARTHPEFFAPPPMAVAHHILKTWALE